MSFGRSSLKVVCVAGARPNFLKIKPVIDGLEALGVSPLFVHTGQHYDEELSDVFLRDLPLRSPDVELSVGSGSHATQTALIMTRFEGLCEKVRPDFVVVVGDVNSTLACALVAAKANSLVAHVEAGLRSRDWSMPEEINRVVTDRLSDYLFAPSEDAVRNLRSEGYRTDQIHLVGNVMIDTLLSNTARAAKRMARLRVEYPVAAGDFGLVTLHRPSNVDVPSQLSELVTALNTVASRLPLIFPVHPRTAQQLALLNETLDARVITSRPLGYLDFLALEMSAKLVLTDSGGIQEETTVLGVPCLTLRSTTERPITISEGTNRLVGDDPRQIVPAAHDVLDHPVTARRPELWDGFAGKRIADAIVTGHESARRRRPTAL